MKKCIILSGIYSSGIGLSNVMVNLVRHLSASFKIVCLGFDPEKQNDEVLKEKIQDCEIYVHAAGGTTNLLKPQKADLDWYIDTYRPVCFITFGPILLNRYLLVMLQQYRANVKIISYISLEGKLVDANFLKYVQLIDYCILYTKCVYEDFNRLLLEHPVPDNGFGTVKSAYAAHGISREKFYPLPAGNDKERRKAARDIIYRDYAVNDDSFIVLNMNRPSLRKRIDTTIKGFKLFAEGKDNVYLHLHIGTTEADVRRRYAGIVDEMGLTDRVIITPEPDVQQVKTENWLNTLYNACDVGISTSRGEGWGFGLFEHAATRAAIVAPDHTSFRENWQGAALMMPCSEKEFVFFEYSDMFNVLPQDVSVALNKLYTDRELLEEVAASCFDRVCESRFDWENVAGKFSQVIYDVIRETDGAPAAATTNSI